MPWQTAPRAHTLESCGFCIWACDLRFMAIQPTATGTLDKTPFAHLLVYVEQRKLSGTLVVWPEGATDSSQGQDRIVFADGQLHAAKPMVSTGDLTTSLLPLFSRRTAPYAFYEADLLGEAGGRLSGPLDPLALIAIWLREEDANDDVVISTLARIGEHGLSLVAGANLQRFGFTPPELALAERAGREIATVSELARNGDLPRSRALRVLYLLVISKTAVPVAIASSPQGEPSGRAAPPSSATEARASTQSEASSNTRPHSPSPAAATPKVTRAAASVSTPAASASQRAASPTSGRPHRLSSLPTAPGELSPEHRQRWQHVLELASRIEGQNYFEMLGVDTSTSASDLRAAFLKMAKEWHPDRLPKELSTLRPHVEVIFGYMSEANACLSDEKQRLSYIQSVREGGGTPEADRMMQRIVDSAMQYERVLIYSRRHEYGAALTLLEEILRATPDEPDYQAMYAWLLMQLNPSVPDSNPPYTKMLDALDKALRLHPDHERAHLYKAQIHKAMGKTREALEGFKRVVEINPNNLDAAREVRIAQMRAEGHRPDTKKKEPTGLLGKLFKKP